MKLETVTLSNTERLSLFSNFSTMLSAGIPILEAVNSLLEDARGNQKTILETLRDDLTQGKRVSTTFAKFPLVFDKVTTSVIRASEESGNLDVTLRDLRETLRKEIEFNDKIKSALLYPVFIIFIFFGVLLLLLVFVIPKIAVVFSRLKVELPLPTRALIFVSNLLLQNTVPTILVLLLLATGIIFLYRKQKNFALNLLFSLPLVNNLVKEIDLTRFSRSLYLLLYSGIPITTALELTGNVVVKKQTTKVIAASREIVLSGKTLSEGFGESKGYIPTVMIKLIEAGEQTGTLDKSMQEISEYFDYQVSKTLKTITTLIEPVMLVAVGIVVGGIMLAIIGPIYGLISQVAPK